MKFFPLCSKFDKTFPRTSWNSAFFSIVIKNIKRYSDLESKLKSALNYISGKEDIIKELEKAKQTYVNGIKDWLNEEDEISYKRIKNRSSIDFKTLKQNKTQAQRVIDLFEEKD
jgi:Mg2+ and Co2+ transporter CorA